MFSKFILLLRKSGRYQQELSDLTLIRESRLFDENWYLAKNPDVAQANWDPILHYLRHGGFERRDPGPNFSSAWYLDTYEDVKKAAINPLIHYLKHGWKEGRQPGPGYAVEKEMMATASSSNSYFDDQAERFFCISMQRTGTTSVGKFFRDFGFRWAGWPADKKNNWSGSWYEAAYEDIFGSQDFREANAFEDSPWFCPDFYKVLFHRFPNSKFILFTRDRDAWFQSMVNHSNGNVIGGARGHSKVYRRELEYFDLLHSGAIDEKVENELRSEKKMKITGHAEQYNEVYRLHNTEVQDFFRRHAPEALHVGTLEDPDKWKKLGKYLGIEVPDNYSSHENQSNSK